MKKPYVHSNFSRKEDDNYQTIDPRCVRALVDSVYISRQERIVDCCSPSGSGIVKELNNLAYIAYGAEDAFGEIKADWIVSNPPYKRGLVDGIIWAQLDRITRGSVFGVAMLLRNNFAFAKSRWDMFENNPYYYGEIKMLFRPIWIEPVPGEKKIEPIHNYVWHIWRKDRPIGLPFIRHWREHE